MEIDNRHMINVFNKVIAPCNVSGAVLVGGSTSRRPKEQLPGYWSTPTRSSWFDP